ncbi:hypothetical protein [Solidesulfovibrio sp.]|uniref:hypothetical protein n=1 Tax=Solidesulfovibrio sp. TaxID=2910990 RepID=UPI002618213A|nr:hypothetical protein [Solidesulfovibrio sp.]
MSAPRPDWGNASRFYLPNEDAAVLRDALGRLGNRARRPVFVGGSGMALLEAAGVLPELEAATFVDVAPFQVAYFRRLLDAVRAAGTPGGLRAWFAEAVYPELRAHYLARGRDYPLPRVLDALENIFGIDFFFDAAALARAKAAAGRTAVVQGDVAAHLAASTGHDCIVLSNVPDYLDAAGLAGLFAACRRHQAPVYLLLTSACPDRDAARLAWERAEFAAHPDAAALDARNRGLGSPTLCAPWNRPGTIHLLVPNAQRSALP